MTEADTQIERARDAVDRQAWAEAHDAFGAVDPSSLTARDLEGLADAAWWVSRFAESVDARQRAYAAYAADGDDLAAGVAAARLAIDHFVRGEQAIGAGFLRRAERHLHDHPDTKERGFLAVVEANVARFGGAYDRASASARLAVEIGERLGDRDLVAMAVHTEGLALVEAGAVTEGLGMMDEAMTAVLGGELTPYFTGVIYCNLIGACLELNDIRRAGEWSDAARLWSSALQPGSPFPGMCRVNRAEVARLRGAWSEAEDEAVQASEELANVEPGFAASAYNQIGEVRRRTGDMAGAEAAFAKAQELGSDPQPGLALLRLAQGRIDAARSALRRTLTTEHQLPRRARLLAADVEVALAAGELDEARQAADELDLLAREASTPAFEAMATTASGALRLAEGDVPAALELLGAACAAWQDLRLPYESAKTRALYGRAIRARGDEEGAELELGAALTAFERLGAKPDAEALARLIGGPGSLPAGLTQREAEVLRLVAAGKTNRDISVELVISEHTVARHLQNIFAKVGVSSRSAATAFAFEHGLT